MKSILSMIIAMHMLVAAHAVRPLSQGEAYLITTVSQKAPLTPFLHFIVHRQATGTALMWSVSAPADIVSFDIERSYDGDFFEVIASKTAGSASINRFKDNNVYPGYLHYRIKAYLGDGSVAYSEVTIVRIVARR